MNKVYVKSDNVFFLFRDVIGGADIDDVYEEYGKLDLNDLDDRKKFIDKCICCSLDDANEEQRQNVRASLLYFLFENPDLIRSQADSYLFPFDFPNDIKEFLLEIWNALFTEKPVPMTDIEFELV